MKLDSDAVFPQQKVQKGYNQKTIAELRGKELCEKPAGSKVDNLTLINGIAAHDLYHAGQIQLLKRLRDKEE